MYGMPIAQSLVFLAAVVVLITAIQWQRFHPFLAIVVIATVFGYIAGFPTSILVRVFGTGFSDAIYAPGLVIVAAALISGIAETTDASDRLLARIEQWRSQSPRLDSWLRFWLRSGGRSANHFAAILALVAGAGASNAMAFALVGPLVRPLGGKTARQREATANSLALGISASHGLVALSPIPIAAAAILDADWSRVAWFGTPLAIVLVAFGALFSRWSAGAASDSSAGPYPPPLPDRRGVGSALALCLAVLVPLALLVLQSVGSIPSEPLGGGPRREFVLGIGGPLILFLAGLGIMIIGQPRQALGLMADSAWTSRIFGGVAGLLLTVCAADGLQRLCQETGMATLLADHLLDWHFGALAILVPFFVAAILKTFQGSSLVAAITAAGMVQPLMGVLGFDGANTKALAALAIGAGAMTVSHVNDDYFWLVTDKIGLAPLRGLTAFSFGTLLQGLLAAAILLILSLTIGNI
jgi:GntP family gluconate:H+ symporter